MTRYEIEISRTVERRLRKLPHADRVRVARAIRALADDPFPRGARKLSGYDNGFRVRSGNYRILYSVFERRLIVGVLKVGHRRDVYR